MPPRTKRLIIYDLDGTLVDTLADITHAANQMLRTFSLPARDPGEIRGYIGRGVRELVRQCLRTSDAAQLDRAVHSYRAFYAEHLLDQSRLYPGAAEVLEHFKERSQAVVTNKPNPYTTQILESLGLARYFVKVVAGDAEFPKKPDPSAVHAILRQTGEAPARAVFIGDSRIDIETGQQAGVMTVGVRHGFADDGELEAAHPDLIVRDFSELLQVAQRGDGW